MRIIDSTYAVGETFIEKVTGTANVSDKTAFETFIGLKEMEYLESYFGYELAKNLIAALDAYKADHANVIPAKYVAILDGAEFTDYNGQLQRWKGLRRDDKTSPIMDYVYYYWRKLKITSTGTSEYMNEIENSVNIGAAEKVRTVWLHGVYENRILADFMRVNSATYPEYQVYAFDYYQRRSLLTPLSIF